MGNQFFLKKSALGLITGVLFTLALRSQESGAYIFSDVPGNPIGTAKAKGMIQNYYAKYDIIKECKPTETYSVVFDRLIIDQLLRKKEIDGLRIYFANYSNTGPAPQNTVVLVPTKAKANYHKDKLKNRLKSPATINYIKYKDKIIGSNEANEGSLAPPFSYGTLLGGEFPEELRFADVRISRPERPGREIGTDTSRGIVRNYLRNRKIEKDNPCENVAVWFSKADINSLLTKKGNSAIDGIRVYFGSYSQNKPRTNTLILVGVSWNHKIERYFDVLKEGDASDAEVMEYEIETKFPLKLPFEGAELLSPGVLKSNKR